MKSTWNKTASKVVEAAKAIAGPVVRAVTANVAHKCDPSGWACDCKRRSEINAASTPGKKNWIPKRKGWLR